LDGPQNPDEQIVWVVRVLVAAYVHQFHRDLWERWHFNPNFWNEFSAWCCNESGQAVTPTWAEALCLTERGANEEWSSNFPNPGDINIFWMDSLIRRYRNQLIPKDFETLLRGKPPIPPADL